MKLLILADDLTGAFDTGVQFASRQIETLVCVEADSPDIPDCEVLCLDLDIRHETPERAYNKTAQALERFPKTPHIYLKTDSVLRGNLSASFAALLHVRGGGVAFVPAWPAAGRVTCGGYQFVNGLPLESSSFAGDPLNPMTTGDLSAILSQTHRVPCISAGLKKYRSDFDRGVIIFDCQSQEELSEIADLLLEKNALSLTAGCAGLAGLLPDRIAFAHKPVKCRAKGAPVLFLSGSANQTTFEQLAHAKACGIPVLTLPPGLKQRGWGREDREFLSLLDHALQLLRSGVSVALVTASRREELCEKPEGVNLERFFAAAADSLMERVPDLNLAVFGGDTTREILKEFACTLVQPVQELHPGIAVSRMADGRYPRYIVTKSGGLGGRDAVMEIEDFLHHPATERKESLCWQ